jgi:hypothetical protein
VPTMSHLTMASVAFFSTLNNNLLNNNPLNNICLMMPAKRRLRDEFRKITPV